MNNGITLLYLSLNHEVYHRQTVFSVLSFFYQTRGATTKDISIVIYCDDLPFFKKHLNLFPVKLELLDSRTINEWIQEGSGNKEINDIDVKTSLKIFAIKKTIETYCQDVFFIDDDTFFTQNPIPFLKSIDKGKTFMYVKEGALTEPGHDNWEKLRQVFNEEEFKIDNKSIKIPLDTIMWNAGVIGINYDDRHLLDIVLNLAIQLQKTDEHPNLYHDQIMFSYIFQNKTFVNNSTSFVYHYYLGYEKTNMNQSLKKLFTQIKNKESNEVLTLVSQKINTPINKAKPKQSFLKIIIVFLKNRSTGFKLACNRVRKTHKISSFFNRGKQF